MLIRSINPTQNENVEKLSKRNNTNFKAGLKPEVVKNQLRIYLTQDIANLKPMVKMPKTPLEKEVILEVLTQRLKLDKYFRLNTERFNTLATIDLYEEKVEKGIINEETEELKKQIDKKGNLAKYFETLNKKIELEKNKNIQAIQYFNDVNKLENEYLERKLVNPSKIDKEYYNIRKNNINSGEEYSTQELIDIISGKTSYTQNETIKTVPIGSLSKAQLFNAVDVAYENILREETDIYEGYTEHYNDAQRARKLVAEKYQEAIQKYPNIQKFLTRIYLRKEEKFAHKVDKLLGVEIYPLSDHWKQMRTVEADIKNLMESIKELKAEMEQNGENSALEAIINGKTKQLEELKQGWIDGLMTSIGSEMYNRDAFKKAGVLNDYIYLIEKNPTLLKHSYVFNVHKENNQVIPDELWEDIVKPSKEFVAKYR